MGAGTILSDNPLLTDRSGRPRRRPLLRVILDSRLRLPLESRLVQNAGSRTKKRCAGFLLRQHDEQKKSQLEATRHPRRDRSRERSPTDVPTCPPFSAAWENSKSHRVMIEGGATVNWTALAADVVDKVFLYYAPKILARHRIDSVRGRRRILCT